MKSLLTTKASTPEEPREVKLHAGLCAGGVGQSAFLPRLLVSKKATERKLNTLSANEYSQCVMICTLRVPDCLSATRTISRLHKALDESINIDNGASR